jgi:hypothetical protein
MQNANVVPTKMFKFMGISLAFINQIPGTCATGVGISDASDRDRVRQNAWLDFTIVDKRIIDLPLVSIPEVNPFVVGSTTVTNATILGTAGGGGQNVPMYKLPIPITLNPYENFSVTINLSAAVALSGQNSMDIYVILQGFMRKLYCAIMKKFIMKTRNIGRSLRWLYRGISNIILEARNDHQRASLKRRWYDLGCKRVNLQRYSEMNIRWAIA